MNVIPVSFAENFVTKRTDREHFECIFLNSKNMQATSLAGQRTVGKVIRTQTVKAQNEGCNIPLENLPSSTCHRHSEVGQIQ